MSRNRKSPNRLTGEFGLLLGWDDPRTELISRRACQSKIAQAEKLACLGQRVTGILHELSNPLTAIIGSAQRLILRDEADGRSADAHRILHEASRASKILRQLLSVSRESRLECQTVSLSELVQTTADLQRTSLAGTELRLQVQLEQNLPDMQANFEQLQQVLLNLLQNAQQAIEESGRGTTIGMRAYTFAPGRVRLEVCDDGPGVPESIQARVFEPFFSTKPPDKGTGLGLAIVKGIVRQHGGTVALESPASGGARFIVELPVLNARTSIETPPLEPLEEFSVTNGTGGPLRDLRGVVSVLVVEDESTVANLIADVLRDEGLSVDVMPDGRTALKAAQRRTYHLAICDMRMPGMDGPRFYKALLNTRNPLCQRVLFVTGDMIARRTLEFLERYRLPHLAKPFRVEELSLAVRGVLQSKCPSTPQRELKQLGNWMGHKHASGSRE